MATQLFVAPPVKAAYDEMATKGAAGSWILYTFESSSSSLKVDETGTDGLEGLSEQFDDGRIQYAFCKVDLNGLNKIVFISWVSFL